MHYYIDGYNLLFRILKGRHDIRKQREELTIDLEKKVSLLDLDVTLVFDSHYQEDDNIKSHFNSLEIIFTAHGQTADEFILQELKQNDRPSQHTVVTSDKKLARLCQLRLGKTESIEEFQKWVEKRYKNKLREKNTQPSKPAQIKMPIEPQKPKTIPPSTPLNSPQSCFEYYLDTFEKEYLALEQQTLLPKRTASKVQKIKPKRRALHQEKAEISDFERWKKAFEKNTSDSDGLIF